MKEQEGEVQELKNNISQLQLERTELITKVTHQYTMCCTSATQNFDQNSAECESITTLDVMETKGPLASLKICLFHSLVVNRFSDIICK